MELQLNIAAEQLWRVFRLVRISVLVEVRKETEAATRCAQGLSNVHMHIMHQLQEGTTFCMTPRTASAAA